MQRRLAFTAILGCLATLGLAQVPGFEAPEAVAREELSHFRAVVNNEVTHQPPSQLDLLLMCGGGKTEYGYVDTNRDGYADTLRTLGSDMVTADQWSQGGTRLLRPLRNRATLRAQGAAAQTMAVHIAVDNGLLDEYAADLDAIDMTQSDRERVRAQANEIIRGATISGTRLISLEGDGGVCLVVRYDVPLRMNSLPTRPTVRPWGGAEDDRKEYEVPPPGSAGDF